MSKISQIYCLACAGGKYYIGRSSRVNQRIQQHFSGHGSVWTSLHKPEKVVYKTLSNNMFDEDMNTLYMMNKHGIENVRGGTFCRVKLPESHKQVIRSMINTAYNKCWKCGSTHHFIRDCPGQT